MTAASPRWLSRHHRGLFWSAVLVAVLAIVGGALVAYVGFQDAAGPDGPVTGYFAALARSDAPAALGYGELPAGQRTLLTSSVLRQQQRVAAIRDVEVLAVDRDGDSARVSVRYVLGFRSGAMHVLDTVPVRKSGDSWRLTAVAVPVRLHLAAAQRASLAGGAVPTRTTLLFPGALPLRFDSGYLQLASGSRYLGFNSPTNTTLQVQVSPAGRQAVQAALSSALDSCFAGSGNPASTCPLPSARYVPGSLKGTVGNVSTDRLSVRVGKGPAGMLSVSGTATFTGSYERLAYDNVPKSGSGSITLPLHASAYAVAPLRLWWVQ
jgi:hypothetical protein